MKCAGATTACPERFMKVEGLSNQRSPQRPTLTMKLALRHQRHLEIPCQGIDKPEAEVMAIVFVVCPGFPRPTIERGAGMMFDSLKRKAAAGETRRRPERASPAIRPRASLLPRHRLRRTPS